MLGVSLGVGNSILMMTGPGELERSNSLVHARSWGGSLSSIDLIMLAFFGGDSCRRESERERDKVLLIDSMFQRGKSVLFIFAQQVLRAKR